MYPPRVIRKSDGPVGLTLTIGPRPCVVQAVEVTLDFTLAATDAQGRTAADEVEFKISLSMYDGQRRVHYTKDGKHSVKGKAVDAPYRSTITMETEGLEGAYTLHIERLSDDSSSLMHLVSCNLIFGS